MDHRAQIAAKTEVYLEEVRAATAAAHDRLRSGMLRLQPQTDLPEPSYDDELLPDPARVAEDPIFATRSFDVPEELTGGLVDFGTPAE